MKTVKGLDNIKGRHRSDKYTCVLLNVYFINAIMVILCLKGAVHLAKKYFLYILNECWA